MEAKFRVVVAVVTEGKIDREMVKETIEQFATDAIDIQDTDHMGGWIKILTVVDVEEVS